MLDPLRPLAKVEVAGSNPIIRSRIPRFSRECVFYE